MAKISFPRQKMKEKELTKERKRRKYEEKGDW